MAMEPTRRSWSPGERTPRADRFWAGSIRIVMAVITIVTLPMFFSGARQYVGVLFACLIGARGRAAPSERQLEELSQRDPLTELYNRRYFVSRVSDELARVRRGHSMVLLMMDLDGFKKVNDTEGHLAGDVLLRDIARAIERSTREVDVVARFGGDEFVAMLTDTESEPRDHGRRKMLAAIRDAGAKTATSRPVTASIGLAAA